MFWVARDALRVRSSLPGVIESAVSSWANIPSSSVSRSPRTPVNSCAQIRRPFTVSSRLATMRMRSPSPRTVPVRSRLTPSIVPDLRKRLIPIDPFDRGVGCDPHVLELKELGRQRLRQAVGDVLERSRITQHAEWKHGHDLLFRRGRDAGGTLRARHPFQKRVPGSRDRHQHRQSDEQSEARHRPRATRCLAARRGGVMATPEMAVALPVEGAISWPSGERF